MRIQLNPQITQTFAGHGARRFGDVMNKLYSAAYDGELYSHEPDIIQLSTQMKDGKMVSAVASFEHGRYAGISFPYEDVKYKSEFMKKILDVYNKAVTKGKSLRLK